MSSRTRMDNFEIALRQVDGGAAVGLLWAGEVSPAPPEFELSDGRVLLTLGDQHFELVGIAREIYSLLERDAPFVLVDIPNDRTLHISRQC